MTALQPSPSQAATATEPYVLGRTAAEHDRLRLQARELEPHTAALLDRVGLRSGMRCLDVGCGPGEVMRLMAERVGARGAVTGIDLDGPLGREAIAFLHAAGHRQCRFEEGDLLTMPRPAGAPFDIVYARLVLIHADRPLATLRRMWSWVAPGGALVLQDYDLDVIAGDPPTPVIDEFKRVFGGVFASAGRSLTAGTDLRRQLMAAGIGAPDDIVADGRLAPMADARDMIAGVYRSTLPLALERGIVDEAGASAWFDEFAALPDDMTARYPTLVGVVRRRRR